MDMPSFSLKVFEGPLDLLLHLIAKNKLNIYDINMRDEAMDNFRYQRSFISLNFSQSSLFP